MRFGGKGLRCLEGVIKNQRAEGWDLRVVAKSWETKLVDHEQGVIKEGKQHSRALLSLSLMLQQTLHLLHRAHPTGLVCAGSQVPDPAQSSSGLLTKSRWEGEGLWEGR